jgi:hypothetical protein
MMRVAGGLLVVYVYEISSCHKGILNYDKGGYGERQQRLLEQ